MDEQDEGGARWDEKDGRKWGKTLSSLWSQPLSWGALRGLALSSHGQQGNPMQSKNKNKKEWPSVTETMWTVILTLF